MQSELSLNQESLDKSHFLDSSKTMKDIYKSANETAPFVVEPTERSKLLRRPEVCSLKNAIDVNIDGKLFCMAHIGQTKHKEALQLCQSLNATLPLPKSMKENYDFIEGLKRLGIDKKMSYFSTKIVLDLQRLPKKGKVHLFLVSSSYVNDFVQLY